jgi:toxin ParE1/3/4
MSLRVLFEAEASLELDEAALWYEEQAPGLGHRFLEAVDEAVDRVSRWPQAAPLVLNLAGNIEVRRAPISPFPYRLIYLEHAGALRALAIAHEARHPDYWQDRLPE